MSTANVLSDEVTNVNTEDSFKKALCMVLRIGTLGNNRKVGTGQIETDADKSLLRASKILFDCDEFKNIQKLDGDIRRIVTNLGLPSMFRSGIYLIPKELLEKVDDKLVEYTANRGLLVEKFIEVYPAQKEIAKQRLASLYDPTDYPDTDAVRESFSVDWQYFTINLPQDLEIISKRIFEREKDKSVKRWEETLESVQIILREAMAELVSSMVDRLKPDADGKQKIFRNSLVTNMRDFLDTFDARNITDDKELSKLVQKARDLTDGIDPDVLRKNAAVREVVRTGFEKIKDTVDTMLVNKPRRIIE